MGVGKQIIGSFEDIGESIVKESVKVPSEIAGKALESLGTSGSGKTKQGQVASTQISATGGGESQSKISDGWETIDQTQSPGAKQAIARAALSALVKRNKEPTVYERQQKEEAQKDEMEKQKEQAAKSQLKPMSTKRPRGDLRGKNKSTTEASKNTRSD